MSGVILKLLIYVIIIGAVWFGIRKIWRDWTAQFRRDDKARHQRDLKERQSPDVITLERDGDGVFRPNSADENRRDPRA